MNIPEKVRIGSMDYDVKLTDETLVLNGRECLGVIDYDNTEIKISKSIQSNQKQEQTFLHELMHGIIRERNLDLQNSDEETIVDEIATGLHQVIRDNQEIFKCECTEIKVLTTIKEGKTLAQEKSIRSKEEVNKIILENISDLVPIVRGLTDEEIRTYIDKNYCGRKE
ncbi:hypothetical protein [Hathewaya massiliensis]|uniref:hypothetical protein n=1 Tax=Hathewaya massiliensis TaxID=1964382 RepID=UPI00163BAD07|nr:hypothetical protein [Hathewaya massiliensis]